MAINQLTTRVRHDIETSQLICNSNQWTGFYIMGDIGRLGFYQLSFYCPGFPVKVLLVEGYCQNAINLSFKEQ